MILKVNARSEHFEKYHDQCDRCHHYNQEPLSPEEGKKLTKNGFHRHLRIHAKCIGQKDTLILIRLLSISYELSTKELFPIYDCFSSIGISWVSRFLILFLQPQPPAHVFDFRHGNHGYSAQQDCTYH